MKTEMKVMNVYLLRHGKTVGNAALNGHTDVLVEPAEQQRITQKVVESQIPFSHIISSPLRRCADLADILAPKIACRVEWLDQIQEISFGEVDGVPFDELTSQWPLLETFWQDPANHQLPKGESLAAFHYRIIEGWKHILQRRDEHLLVVTHGGVIRLLLAHLLDLDWKNAKLYSNLSIANASVTHIQVSFLLVNALSAADDGQEKKSSKREGEHYCCVKSIGTDAWPKTE